MTTPGSKRGSKKTRNAAAKPNADQLKHIAPDLHDKAVPIGSVRPDPDNANRHDQRSLDAIKKSLSKFGQQKPIVVDKQGVCVAGSGTLTAAYMLGWPCIAALQTNLTAKQARAFAIGDNRTGELSSFDNDVLLRQINELGEQLDGFDTADIGFDDKELAKIQAALNAADDDDAGGRRQQTLEESWQVNVICADAREQREVHEKLKADGYKCEVNTLYG